MALSLLAQMDREELEDAVDDWVAAEIITREQADAILARHEGDERSLRLITALSVMGAVLIGAGAILYLTGNWAELPRTLRAAILLTVPTAAYGSGGWLRRGEYPRVGHGLFVLGAAFVGVSLFALADLYEVDIAAEWLLVAWTAVALPSGHLLGSRLITALGLGVGAATLVTATSFDPAVVTGLYGVGLFVHGAMDREPRWSMSYLLVGVAATLGSTVALMTSGGRLGPSPELDLVLVGVTLGAAAMAVRTAVDSRSDGDASLTLWAAVAIIVLLVFPPLASVDLSSFATSVTAHLLALIVVLVTVGIGYRLRETGVVNISALAFLAVVLSFLARTVANVLSGSLTLIIGGLILLAVGLGLERGRRTLLERMDASGAAARERSK